MYHPSFNIGIQEEFQLIDGESRELLGYLSQDIAQGQIILQERNPEEQLARQLGSAVLEVGTRVCADLPEAREQLLFMRSNLLEQVHRHGLKVAAAGTHPFSSWEERSLVVPRYRDMVEDAQMIARRMLAFGLHIHIGVEDRELAIDVMNSMRYLLPHILSLSSSSPFWAGRNTGLKSYRTVLLNALPRTGIPSLFGGYHEYRGYVDTLVRTNCIPDASKIWYDILPHHRYPTLVIRICDMLPDYRDSLAITALIQAIVAWMVDLRQRNMSFRIYERTLVHENKWRAVRYGLDGNMIDFGIEQEVPTRDLIRELMTLVEPTASRLNSQAELAHIETILARGTSADAQIDIWQNSDQNYHAVVDHIVRETEKIA